MADLAYTKQVVENMESGASMVTAATPGIITRHFDDMKAMRQRMQRDSHKLEGRVEIRQEPPPAEVNLAELTKKKRTPSKAIPIVAETLDSDDGEDQDEDDNVKPAGSPPSSSSSSSTSPGADHLGEVMVNIVRALGIERDYKPRLIQSLHKTRTMSSNLRSLKDLCGVHFERAMTKLERIRMHFCSSGLFLSLQQQDSCYLSSACSVLMVNGVPLTNFNWRLSVDVQKESVVRATAVGGTPTSGTEETMTETEDWDFRSFAEGSMDNYSAELIDQTMAYVHGVVVSSPLAAQLHPHQPPPPPQRVSPRSSSSEDQQSVLPLRFDELDPINAHNFVKASMAATSDSLQSVAGIVWPSEASPHPHSLLLRRFSFSKVVAHSFLLLPPAPSLLTHF